MAAEKQRLKILIIDDELDMHIFLCNLLGTCGYAPIDAGDRKEGLQKAREEKPALIILDVIMPKESEQLGGNLTWLQKTLEGYPAAELLADSRSGVEKHPNINVHNCSRIRRGLFCS